MPQNGREVNECANNNFFIIRGFWTWMILHFLLLLNCIKLSQQYCFICTTVIIFMINLDDLNELPEWSKEDDDGDGEGWKPNPTRELCKAMYKQWNTVLFVLKTAFDSLKQAPPDSLYTLEYIDETKAMVLGDAYEVGAKIKSSEVGLYIIRMENAAIIRKNAQFIKISTHHFIEEELMSEEYSKVIRDEIDKFKELFKQWVASFEKDEFEDEWGLFL